MNNKKSSARVKLISAIPLLSLFLMYSLSFNPLFISANFWLSDLQKAWWSEEKDYSDIVVVDIDRSSLEQLGAFWESPPEEQEIYSQILDYLNNVGAGTVVLDILLASDNVDEYVLRQAIQRHGSAVLIGTGTNDQLHREISKLALPHSYEPLLWNVDEDIPYTKLNSVLLPPSRLIDSRPEVGIVAAVADSDGLVRKIPLLYKMGDNYLSSLPLALHREREGGGYAAYNSVAGEISVGGRGWPVDDEARMTIYYPKNEQPIKLIPFSALAEAALMQGEDQEIGLLFQGKTVFIGSTALQDDSVMTPRGAMSGSYVLALAYQSMKNNLLLRPQSLMWDIVLVLLALLPSTLIALRRYVRVVTDSYIAVLTALVIVAANAALLRIDLQQSTLLFPLLIVLLAYVMNFISHRLLTKEEHVKVRRLGDELNEVRESLLLADSTDALTGLGNRGSVLHSIEAEIDRFSRKGTTFSIMLVSLDRFKTINDRYGQSAGDEVIKACARLLDDHSRKLDVVGRWHGAEFAMVLPRTSESGTEVLYAKLQQQFKILQVAAATRLVISISAGSVEYTAAMAGPDACVSLADAALQQAKAAGRNCLVVA